MKIGSRGVLLVPGSTPGSVYRYDGHSALAKLAITLFAVRLVSHPLEERSAKFSTAGHRLISTFLLLTHLTCDRKDGQQAGRSEYLSLHCPRE
jgi:hypothetical protein